MKIPQALESMVADLISDAQRERDEVEAVLGQIAVLVEAFKDKAAPITIHAPDQPDLVPPDGKTVHREEDFEPAPRLDYQTRWNNFKKFREKMGDPPARAEEVATEMCNDE